MGKKSLLHQVKCSVNKTGVLLCDISTVETSKDSDTMIGAAVEAHRTWQDKLAKITKYTKDFAETSVKILNGVPCTVRYIYRANMA